MTTTHRKNVPINDEALAKRSAKKIHVPKYDISLTLKGAPLNPSLVNADATIVVLFRGLQGGADYDKTVKLDGDQKPNDSFN